MNIPFFKNIRRWPDRGPAALWMLLLLVGQAGCSDLHYGPEEVLSVELKTGPGVIVEVVPVHESLSERRLSGYDVNDKGVVVVIADGSIYDLVSGRQLSHPDIQITSVAFVSGNLVVSTTDDQIGAWGQDGIDELTSLPLTGLKVAPGKRGEFLVWGETFEGDHALVSFELEGPPQFLSGSPLPILASAASSQQTWFSVEETLFNIREAGSPEIILALPEETSVITGVALSGGRKYFSTSDTVFLIRGSAVTPLVIGIGGQIRAAAGGIFVLDERLGHLYRIVAEEGGAQRAPPPDDLVRPGDDEGSATLSSPPGGEDQTPGGSPPWIPFAAVVLIYLVYLAIVDKVTESGPGSFLLYITGSLIGFEILAFRMDWEPTILWYLGPLAAILLAVRIGRPLLEFVGFIIDELPRWIGWILFVPAGLGIVYGVLNTVLFGYDWLDFLIVFYFTGSADTLSVFAKAEMPLATFGTIAGFFTAYACGTVCRAVLNHSSRPMRTAPVEAERTETDDDPYEVDFSDDTLVESVEPRSKKGLYGTLIGCLVGLVVWLMYPVESSLMPIIGWGIGTALPSRGPRKRRSLGVFIGTLGGFFAMGYLATFGVPNSLLMIFPFGLAISAWHIERKIDRRKILRPVCRHCSTRIEKDERVICASCGQIVHRSVCSIQSADGHRYCQMCYEVLKEQNEPKSSGDSSLSSSHEDFNSKTPEPDSTGTVSVGSTDSILLERPDCPVCGNEVGVYNRTECSDCGAIVHISDCSIYVNVDTRLCRTCNEDSEEAGESEAGESEAVGEISAEEDDPDEMLTLETSITFGPAEERIALSLNRLFAACRSLRGSNPIGYQNSRDRLDQLREELQATPIRMNMIENRVLEMSGGTFHWDP